MSETKYCIYCHLEVSLNNLCNGINCKNAGEKTKSEMLWEFIKRYKEMKK